MGYICQRKPLCHFTLILLATVALSPTSANLLAQEPEDCNETLPALWHMAPGNFSDYTRQGNKIVINAWNYAERMGLYKMLLNSTAKYFATLGPNNVGNILWGLPLQHGWQFVTGRLADPLNTSTCGHDGNRLCISARSWWPCMNYYLAIIPFLGALESGMFGELPYEVEMLPPNEQRDDFCHSIAECNTQVPKIMSKWRHFFKYLLSTTWNSGSPSVPSFSKEEALKYLWDAHDDCITFAFSKFQNRLPYLREPERSFAKDWYTTVKYVAPTRFPTDQCQTNHLQAGLPPRILLKGDNAPFIGDFTFVQNKALVVFSCIRKTNEISGGASFLFWKIVMSTEEGRKIGRSLIESVV
ncbi:protein LEG1 homolog [Tiliqua scincoides]|uniref:protein LEG1 homolog n=1 Tax=Tiliqua scincoides TaxID=71010 RepID=UPI0034635129